jgi:GAF domain-containing protein
VVDRKTVQIADLAAESGAEYPEGKAVQRLIGHRTALATPLLRDGAAVGAILIQRMQVMPFTDKQVRLLETFANQAAIAINNVGLFEELQARTKELQTSLEYQTASSGVLEIISQSPSQLQSVFDAIARNASSVCAGEYAIVTRCEGSLLHLVAQHNERPGTGVETASSWPRPLDRRVSLVARAILDGDVVNVADIESEDLTPEIKEFHRRIGAQSLLSVPMVQGDRPIGAIAVSRTIPEAFSDRQVALLRTFARQAVIAIENARLLGELQTRQKELEVRGTELTRSLEYQTAITEVLGVISQSKFDLQPVLDTITGAAARLAEADKVVLRRRHNEHYQLAAFFGVTAEQADWLNTNYADPSPGSLLERLISGRRTIHAQDVQNEFRVSASALAISSQTALGVPLLREGELIGTLVLHREKKRGFTPEQIALIETFADQAVIAIENARLLDELQTRQKALTESLEYQTAAGHVLEVISSSPTDAQPV